MACRRCISRGDVDGKPRECAFENGVFDPHNWHCETMDALRDRISKQRLPGHMAGSGREYAAIIPLANTNAFLVFEWTAHCYRVGGAWVLYAPYVWPLTIELAEAVLADYSEARINEAFKALAETERTA